MVTRSARSQFLVATSWEGTGAVMIRSEEPAQPRGSSITKSQVRFLFCLMQPKKPSTEKNRFVLTPLMMARWMPGAPPRENSSRSLRGTTSVRDVKLEVPRRTGSYRLSLKEA